MRAQEESSEQRREPVEGWREGPGVSLTRWCPQVDWMAPNAEPSSLFPSNTGLLGFLWKAMVMSTADGLWVPLMALYLVHPRSSWSKRREGLPWIPRTGYARS